MPPVERERRLRILYVSPRQCWPPVSGAKLRDYHLARALGCAGELTCVHYLDPRQSRPELQDMPFCKRLIPVDRPSAYTVPKIARGLAGRWPLPVLNYTSPAMAAALNQSGAGGPFDIVHLDSIHMAAHAERLPTPHVYDWHNIESEAMERYGERSPSLPHRLYARLTAKRLRALEARLLRSAFGHIVCSERERDQLLAREPRARVAVVPNGVDTAYFANPTDGVRVRHNRIVFVGSMDYPPNIEAAASFVRETWPSVRTKLPERVSLTIVGANPTPAVLQLAAQPAVEVTGTVADVRPYYSDAFAAVVPIRSGGGTRLKILEAMAAGVPVVSTPLGAEGLHVSGGRNIVLVEPADAEGWAHELALLASNEVRRCELAAAGLDLVRSRYDWAVIGQALSGLYRRWTERGA
jgi:glycosyltransferase involved in cell wall biosynthesis